MSDDSPSIKKEHLEKQLYASVLATIYDWKNFRHNEGMTFYNKLPLTERGEKAVIDLINLFGNEMLDNEIQIQRELAKEMTWNAIKDEK